MISYHTSGARAFLIEDDGTTLCEVVAPGRNSAASVAAVLVAQINVGERAQARLMDAERTLKEWRNVFGHLGETPDECGNAIYNGRASLDPQ